MTPKHLQSCWMCLLQREKEQMPVLQCQGLLLPGVHWEPKEWIVLFPRMAELTVQVPGMSPYRRRNTNSHNMVSVICMAGEETWSTLYAAATCWPDGAVQQRRFHQS